MPTPADDDGPDGTSEASVYSNDGYQKTSEDVDKEEQASKPRRRKELNNETYGQIIEYGKKLQDPYSTVIYLYYIEGQSYLKIASKLQTPIGTIKSYINRGMKMLRKIAEDTEHLPLDQEKYAFKHLRAKEDFVNHVNELYPKMYRQAVYLHYIEKLSYPEVARQLNLPLGTVKSHVSRGMRMLRRSF